MQCPFPLRARSFAVEAHAATALESRHSATTIDKASPARLPPLRALRPKDADRNCKECCWLFYRSATC